MKSLGGRFAGLTLVFVSLLWITPGFGDQGSAAVKTAVKNVDENVAETLMERLAGSLYTEPLDEQGKYARMLYRITGNKVWLNTATAELYIASDRLLKFSHSLRNDLLRKEAALDAGWLKKDDDILLFQDYVFYSFMVLPELNRLHYSSLELKGNAGDRLEKVISGFDFRPGLQSAEVIRRFAPNQAEQVYALINLGLGDYRKLYIEAFKRVYPAHLDKKLTKEQLNHKWKAMTHLVLAASDFLQGPVNDSLVTWVPQYFRDYPDSVLKEANSELLAKIGICLHLTGHHSSTLLHLIHQKLISELPKDSGDSLRRWETLLLNWTNQYFPDPPLFRMKHFQGRIPLTLLPSTGGH
ncbi:MAG: DUF3541 domain-containing protein [Endozoicomonas sp.]